MNVHTLNAVDCATLDESSLQNINLKSLIIYHQIKEGVDCADGISAAWVCDRYLRNLCNHPDILGCSYQSVAPDVSKYDKIFVLDFSFPRDIINSWIGLGKSVVMIDHHKTAKEMLGDISTFSNQFNFDFDLLESGATLTWKHFHSRSDRKMPAFLEYVRDRDLWNHLLPMTKEIHEASASMRFELRNAAELTGVPARDLIFAAFDHLATLNQEQLIEMMANRGFELLKPKRAAIDRAVARMEYKALPRIARDQMRDMTIPIDHILPDGTGNLLLPEFDVKFYKTIPVVYVLPDGSEDRLMSDICAKLYKNTPEAPFVACVTADGAWSLRSDKNGSNFDVSKVAELYGGGGHRNASGFKVGGSDAK